MGICISKSEIILSNKEQVEFLCQIRLQLNELENYVNSLKEDEVNYKMTRYLFIINAMKELKLYLEIIESGRRCDLEIKLIFQSIIESIKNNDRKNYSKSICDLKLNFAN